MGQFNFYVLWSLQDAPRQFISKANRKRFQVHIPLPLPKQLVIFGLGEWPHSEATVSVEVLVSEEAKGQKIGTLSRLSRCLTWEGAWSSDMVTVAAEKGRRGAYGKVLLLVCGQPPDQASFSSSTPRLKRNSTPWVKRSLFPELHDTTDESHTLNQSAVSQKMSSSLSHLRRNACYAELHTDKNETLKFTLGNESQIWPMHKTPGHKVFAVSFKDEDSTAKDMSQASSRKKMKLSRVNSQEENTAQIKDCRDVCPSKRWRHTMCLSDPVTAVVIGGETTDQNHCEDSMWKLEIDNDFWFPMSTSTSGPIPPCARGHSATYDPDSKRVFVYGGLREGQCYSELYILDTLTWKWKLVTAKGNIPSLAYHSATFYKKDLFVFGGIQPGYYPEDIKCCNSLYIFNPEFEIWYEPIVEGSRPRHRFGHSATLLSDSLIIFGGQSTALYLNDLHILDLGFMEYREVKCENLPPVPRGFHAALPVSANKMLVSGGCSATGALQDVHIFDMDTMMWSSVVSPLLCSRPRAGHSIINLGNSIPTHAGKKGEHGKTQSTVLVFGGSDCCGTFYNDTIKCKVDILADE